MFDELLNLSKKIINGYQELEKLITEITIKSATNFKVNQDAVMKNYLVYTSLIKSYSFIVDKFNSNMTKLINAKVKELRELITEENKLLNCLTEDEVDSFIKSLERIDTNNDECISRLRERLMVRGYILEGYSFRGNKILNNSILYNMNFYDKEILPCILKIDVYKRLRNKIRELASIKDFLFVRKLYILYEEKKFKEMKNNAFMELIIFMYNCDVELVPSIEAFDIEELKNLYVENDNVIVDWAIDLIADIDSIDCNTKDINEFFELLYYFTYLEVLMDYMNLEELRDFEDEGLDFETNCLNIECGSTNHFREVHAEDTTPNMKLVRRLVKRRLDEEKN